MGKNKRLRLASKSKPARNKVARKGQQSNSSSAASHHQPHPKAGGGGGQTKKKHIQLAHLQPTIPFSPADQILLIGEGDLSFARALVEAHGCAHVTATVYEGRQDLEEKYPHVSENVVAIEAAGGSVRFGVDASKPGPLWRDVRGKIDRVVFNFPHVGGKSTDVNRQVRYNQELLVSFFENAQGALAPRGSIIVTLFEGMPYTLWNIRDLGRHSGLQVEKSFKFQAKAYPGYRHARTLGVIKGKDGKDGGGWRGEERESRSYVFMRKGDVTEDSSGRSLKRKKGDSDSDSDSEDESSAGGGSVGWNEDEQDDNEEEEGQKEEGEEQEEADEENWDGIHDSEDDHPERSEAKGEE